MTSPLRDGRLKRDRLVSSVATRARSAPVIFSTEGAPARLSAPDVVPGRSFTGGALTPQQ